MEELIGIYKGLRMPLLGFIILVMTFWVFRPSRKRENEQARFNMLDDEFDGELGARFEPVEEEHVKGAQHGG